MISILCSLQSSGDVNNNKTKKKRKYITTEYSVFIVGLFYLPTYLYMSSYIEKKYQASALDGRSGRASCGGQFLNEIWKIRITWRAKHKNFWGGDNGGVGKGETKPKTIAKTKTRGLKALGAQQSAPRWTVLTSRGTLLARRNLGTALEVLDLSLHF